MRRPLAGHPARLIPALLPMLAALGAADAPSPPTIRTLMHRQYTVSRAPFKIIGAEIDAEVPDWEKVRLAGEKFGALADDLAKNTPRHGSPDAWRRRMAQHAADAKAMQDAARDRDLDALRAAHRRIADSCKTCHAAHRYRRGD
jgi:cytochrome c556